MKSEPEGSVMALGRPGAADEILARQRLIDCLLGGARVLELGALAAAGPAAARSLQDRGAASVVSVDRDPARVREAERDGAGPGLRFIALEDRPWDALGTDAFELVLAHDPGWLLFEPGLAKLREWLAPSGQLLVALPGGGPRLASEGEGAASDPPTYETLLALLREAFPSVEVSVQRAILGHALLPIGASDDEGLEVEELGAAPEAAGQILFLCGQEASGVLQRRIVLSEAAPILEGIRGQGAGAHRGYREGADAQAAEARIDEEAIRALEERHRAEVAALEARLAALRALAAAPPPPDPEELADEALMRRLREAEERAEAARLHAREAEERMRAAEHRAEAAESERARLSLAARRYQAEADQLRRSSAGIAASLGSRR